MLLENIETERNSGLSGLSLACKNRKSELKPDDYLSRVCHGIAHSMRSPHSHDEKIIEHGQHDERQKLEDDIGENVEDLLVQLMLAKVRVEHLNNGVLFGNPLEIELGFSSVCGANSSLDHVKWGGCQRRISLKFNYTQFSVVAYYLHSCSG